MARRYELYVQVGRYKTQVTGRRSQVTGHRSQVTGHRSQVTGHRSQVSRKKNSQLHNYSCIAAEVPALTFDAYTLVLYS